MSTSYLVLLFNTFMSDINIFLKDYGLYFKLTPNREKKFQLRDYIFWCHVSIGCD